MQNPPDDEPPWLTCFELTEPREVGRTRHTDPFLLALREDGRSGDLPGPCMRSRERGSVMGAWGGSYRLSVEPEEEPSKGQ